MITTNKEKMWWQLIVDGELESITQFIHENPSYLNIKHKIYRQNALSLACSGVRQNVVKFLLSLNADINDLDADGWTPLIYACFRGSFEICELLLNAGANVHHRDKTEWTALTYAYFNKRYDFVEFLLGFQADVNELFKSDDKLKEALNIKSIQAIVDARAGELSCENRRIWNKYRFQTLFS